jgi:hypothetical protein
MDGNLPVLENERREGPLRQYVSNRDDLEDVAFYSMLRGEIKTAARAV